MNVGVDEKMSPGDTMSWLSLPEMPRSVSECTNSLLDAQREARADQLAHVGRERLLLVVRVALDGVVALGEAADVERRAAAAAAQRQSVSYDSGLPP